MQAQKTVAITSQDRYWELYQAMSPDAAPHEIEDVPSGVDDTFGTGFSAVSYDANDTDDQSPNREKAIYNEDKAFDDDDQEEQEEPGDKLEKGGPDDSLSSSLQWLDEWVEGSRHTEQAQNEKNRN
ncbi:hypothetical protein FKG94_00425 [Exilibacterium tricleocarpae]|uniref:Uncharacterized protein n=1 Tax=Exilibacterium tricleocarpae TaxID=2591008 RepID=A0A545U9B0_9GAMM|nr:hypothetical protein [Exilibacterium tricleocarpae]TQV86060.1 hypothetical protein FKG94_00425 [Exilibacterium tricleocarpae]